MGRHDTHMQSFFFFVVAVIACSSADPHHVSTDAHQADMIVPKSAAIKTGGLAGLLRLVHKDANYACLPLRQGQTGGLLDQGSQNSFARCKEACNSYTDRDNRECRSFDYTTMEITRNACRLFKEDSPRDMCPRQKEDGGGRLRTFCGRVTLSQAAGAKKEEREAAAAAKKAAVAAKKEEKEAVAAAKKEAAAAKKEEKEATAAIWKDRIDPRFGPDWRVHA